MATGILRAKFITLNTYVRNKDQKSVSWAVNSGSWDGGTKQKNPKERIKSRTKKQKRGLKRKTGSSKSLINLRAKDKKWERVQK